MVKKYSFISSFFHRVSHKERSFVSRQLAVMLDSGLPISQAIRSLIEQTDNETLERILGNIVQDLENGYKFSAAIKKYPHIFNSVFVSVVAAGEATGKLDTAMELLANELERDESFKAKIVGAMLYPAFIVVAMIVVGIIMVTKIVPALKIIFDESGVQLPWTTRLVVTVTESLIHYWYFYIAGLVLGIFLLIHYLTSVEGRRTFNALLVRVPGVGSLVRNLEMARFTRIFSVMIKSGVPIIQSLDAVGQVLDNYLYQEGINTVARNVERGAPMSQSLARNPIFPIILTQMVSVGEQTGKMDAIFEKLANYYEEETNQAIKNITALVEPIIFVIVGLGVAFIVFSIIVPIYSLANVIK